MVKLNAKELRVSEPTKEDLAKIKRREIYIICDNVLDTYNIGSIFRLADAVAAKCVYLCGQSETPPNSRISKASIGTDKWVPWEYTSTAVEAIEDVRKRHSRLDRESRSIDSRPSVLSSGSKDFRGNDITGAHSRSARSFDRSHSGSELRIIAIEQSKKSVDFRKINYQELVTRNQALVFVVGHETEGVSKEALKLADEIVEIPMFGVNKSLNVMVSLAIVVYQAIG